MEVQPILGTELYTVTVDRAGLALIEEAVTLVEHDMRRWSAPPLERIGAAVVLLDAIQAAK